MLSSLCGEAAMNHLTLCTTMWDRVTRDEGEKCLADLCATGIWKEMVEIGATTVRIVNVGQDAKVQAENLMNELVKNVRPVELKVQNEMIKQGKAAAQTGAWQILIEHFREVRAEAEQEVRKVCDITLKEVAAEAAKVQETESAQELKVEKLETQVNEQRRV